MIELDCKVHPPHIIESLGGEKPIEDCELYTLNDVNSNEYRGMKNVCVRLLPVFFYLHRHESGHVRLIFVNNRDHNVNELIRKVCQNFVTYHRFKSASIFMVDISPG